MNSAYNSLNHMSWMLMPENTTIHAIQINTFVCPSDYLALRTLDAALSPRFPSFSPWRDDVARKVARASYAGIISTTFVYALPDMKLNCKIDSREVPLANGILTDIGPITQASIGDGSSKHDDRSRTRVLRIRFRKIHRIWWQFAMCLVVSFKFIRY